jgi:hypothetical protein
MFFIKAGIFPKNFMIYEEGKDLDWKTAIGLPVNTYTTAPCCHIPPSSVAE